ncbi:DNA-binding response regulator, NarL/FixJ family, contains REC and HTH domains [Roseateles sp. YR242]|uniref:response regulator n=1 Tax=Roseateles sp. YR242 TaxID=1855305 RepID=UPI0008B469F1|nr:response regulator [Roseateles sp. YR242]SEK59458.1 DNA-binding response regulator, NarL/FixJ family, contains REC and HTH domains [Roseateles sp. YR242]
MDIFLVEDSSAIRRLLARRLDSLPGTRVVGEAEGAPQAVALIDWLQPDTVLLDMNLAIGTGLDVLRDLRGRGYKGRILMLSSQCSDIYRDRCIKAGADGFYDKGTGLETLFGDLDELLQSERASGKQLRFSPLLRDTVTGLLGQVALLERLDQVLRMLRADPQPVAVAVVVLRGLQALLLSHGPAATAPLLVELGQRMKSCTGDADLLARHADEQFALVVTRVDSTHDADALTHRLDDALSLPFELAGKPIRLHCSVGMAIYPRDAISARGLLNLAESRAHGECLPSDGSAVVH